MAAPLTDKQIMESMKKTAPWLWAMYNSPEFTDENRKVFMGWARRAAKGETVTAEEKSAATYNWPITQLWSANQQAKFEMSYTNPGQYKAELAAAKTNVSALIKRKGLKVDAETLKLAIDNHFMRGWKIDDPRLVEFLAGTYKYDPTEQVDASGVPVVNDATRAIDSFAVVAANYGIPMPKDPAQMEAFVKAAIGPTGTIENFTEYAKIQAKNMYGFMAGAIDAGATVKGYLQPYATHIENTLDLLPGSINWQDPKWQSLVAKPDPSKPGVAVAQSMNDILTTVRTDPQYGYDKTTTAKNSAYALADNLKQKFGKAAG